MSGIVFLPAARASGRSVGLFLTQFHQLALQMFLEHLGGVDQRLQRHFRVGTRLERAGRLQQHLEELVAELLLFGGQRAWPDSCAVTGTEELSPFTPAAKGGKGLRRRFGLSSTEGGEPERQEIAFPPPREARQASLESGEDLMSGTIDWMYHRRS